MADINSSNISCEESGPAAQQIEIERDYITLSDNYFSVEIRLESGTVKSLAANRLGPTDKTPLYGIVLERIGSEPIPEDLSDQLIDAAISGYPNINEAVKQLEKLAEEHRDLIKLTLARHVPLPYHPPAQRIDQATGFREKGVILSDDALGELNKRLGPGEKIVFYFDFDHLSVPNKFGLERNIDGLLGEIKEIAEQCFLRHGISAWEIIRTGGDEFAGFAPYSKDVLAALEDFKKEFEKTRRRYLDPEDSRVQQSMKYAAVREGMRALLSEYKKELYSAGRAGNQNAPERRFTLQGYRKRLIDLIEQEDGLNADAAPTASTGDLELLLTTHRIKSGKWPKTAQVGSFSLGAVNVGEDLTAKTVHRGIGAVDKEIHRLKESRLRSRQAESFPIQVLGSEATSAIQIRSSMAYEVSQVADMTRKFEEIKALFDTCESMSLMLEYENRLKLISVQDAGIGIPRLNLARHLKARELSGLNVSSKKEVFAVYVDNSVHAAVNSEQTPQDADSDFSTIGQAFSTFTFGVNPTRINGGAQIILIDAGREKQQEIEERLGKIKANVENALLARRSDAGREVLERLSAQYDSRAALRAMLTGNRKISDRSDNFFKGALEVRMLRLEIDPDETLESICGRIEEDRAES